MSSLPLTSASQEINQPKSFSRTISSGLICFELLCHFHKIPVDIRRLLREHALNESFITPEELLRLAKQTGFRSKLKRSLPVSAVQKNYPLPALNIKNIDSEELVFLLVLKWDSEKKKALVFDPESKETLTYSFHELSHDWIILSPRNATGLSRFGLNWFFQELTRFKLVLAEVFLGSFFVQLFGLITPLFTQIILDKVIVHRALNTLDILGIAFVAIAFFELLLNLARQYIFTHTASKLDVKLGVKLFKHLFSLSYNYFETRKVGDTLSRVRELETIRTFLAQKSVSVLIDLIFSTLFLVVMFIYSVQLTWIVLGFVGLISILYIVMTPVFRQRLEAKFQMAAKNHSYLVEALTGMQTVKALAIEGQMQRYWENHLGDYVKSGFDLSKLQHVTSAAASLFQRLMTLAILYFGVKQVLEGTLTIGQLIAFNMFSGQFTGPILRLVNLWHEIQQALLGVDRVGDILNQPTEQQSSRGITLPKIRGELTFDNVKFRYSSESPIVLKGLSFTVEAGSSVGIVGRSGSGKSTLTKLVQKLYLPNEGMILLDNVDLRQLNPQWLRHNIGVVLQENYLFSGTIANNIAMAKREAPIEKIIQVARLAGAHEFITEMPEGYDTLVGERGASLSGGQRQRLAIARALITDPKLLILDEATSALDYESEKVIRTNLANIQKNRTVLIIAHRLSTVERCDTILVLDKGELVEKGSHHDLLAQHGLYKHLYHQQRNEGFSHA